MRKLFYEIEAYTSVCNPETEEIEEVLSPVGAVVYNPTDADIAQAKAIAYNGEYTVEGESDPDHDTASTDDVLNALLGVTE